LELKAAVRFAVKHAVAAAIVITGIAGFTAALYFALFAAAVIFDQPIGSPVAGPLMVVFVVIASLISVVAILLPVTAFTEWISQRRGLRVWWQIPIATIVMWMWVLVLALATAALRGAPIGSTAVAAGIAFLVLLIPLGIYWWSMRSADWILGMMTSWRLKAGY
jgi:hypothetical protein